MNITYFLTIALLLLNGINANPRRGSDDLNQEYDRNSGLTLLENHTNYTLEDNLHHNHTHNLNSTSHRSRHRHRHGGYKNKTRYD